MKKAFVILFLIIAVFSFSYIYFRSSDVLLYPNKTVYFYCNNEPKVRVYKYDISWQFFNKNFSGGKLVNFILDRVEDDLYSITLPDEQGAYYVVVEDLEAIKSNIFFLTNYEAFIASDSENLYFSVYDLKNNKFVNVLKYYDSYSEKIINGPIFKIDVEKYKNKVFFYNNNVVFISNYGGYNPYPLEKAVVFTDKPIYKPGDILHFRINLFKRNNDRYIPYSSKINVSLKDPFNNEVYSNTFITDEYGGAFFDFQTTDEIITGNYTLVIESNDKEITWHYVMIEDYVKPTYTLEITPSSTLCLEKTTVSVKLSTKYLNGDPVSHAQVVFYTFKFGDLINKTKAITNENGEAAYDVFLKESGFYKIQAIVVDDSGKQFEKSTYVEVKKDNVNINAEIKNNVLNLYITDLLKNPLNGVAAVEINDNVEYVEILKGKGILSLPKNVWYVNVKFGKEERLVFKKYIESEAGIIFVDKNTVNPGDRIKVTVDPKNDVGILVVGGVEINSYKIITQKSEVYLNIPTDEISSKYFIRFLGVKTSDNIGINIDHNRVKKLQIKLDKEIYKPGEDINVEFVNSESLKVVSIADEGLYLLSGYSSICEELYPDIYYSPFDLYKSSKYIYFDSLSKFESKKNSHVFATTKESGEKKIREYFPESFYWNPQLFESKISLKTPDNITKWRIVAYEISNDYIAEGSATFVVTKPFEVKLFVPDFLTVGDESNCSIYIKNYTGKQGKVSVTLDVNNGVSTFESGTFLIEKELSIPFVLKNISEGKDVEIVLKASMQDEFDGIKITIPVNSVYITNKLSKIVKIEGEKEFEKGVGIKVINNIKDLLVDSIKGLINYPYGCTEQTMSSFYPALVAKDLLESDEIDHIVLKGLQRLLKLQHRDGGWGWWSNDESSIYMTSYVLEGLYYAKQKGYYFPHSVVTNAINYLKNQKLNGYAIFVLKLYGEEDIKFEFNSTIDFIFTSPEKIKEIAIEGKDKAYIPGEGFYSSIYLTSYAIRILERENKYPDLKNKMINYLLSMKKGPFWYSTKDTAAAILSLLEGIRNFNSDLSVYEFDDRIKVEGNGYVEIKTIEKIYKEKEFNGISLKSDVYKRYEFLFSGEYIDAFLPVSSKYIPIKMKMLDATPTVKTDIPNDILNIIDEGTPISFVDDKLVIKGPFKFIGNDYYFDDYYYEIHFIKSDDFSIHKGDFLKTTITIDGTGEYLIVEEYLPACAQVNKYYREKNPDYYGKFSYLWYENDDIWYSYRDLKKDKIAFFIRYLRPGKLSYYWRAAFSGEYIKKPAHVYNMYYENTYAFGSSYTFTIK